MMLKAARDSSVISVVPKTKPVFFTSRQKTKSCTAQEEPQLFVPRAGRAPAATTKHRGLGPGGRRGDGRGLSGRRRLCYFFILKTDSELP